VLDILDGLVAECSGQEKADAIPDHSDPTDPSDPLVWQEISRVVAQIDIPGCRNPRLWLSQIRAVANGSTIDLKARSGCVQDMTRHHLMTVIETVAGRRGLLIGDVSCVS
jgi:hypothetical protein